MGLELIVGGSAGMDCERRSTKTGSGSDDAVQLSGGMS